MAARRVTARVWWRLFSALVNERYSFQEQACSCLTSVVVPAPCVAEVRAAPTKAPDWQGSTDPYRIEGSGRGHPRFACRAPTTAEKGTYCPPLAPLFFFCCSTLKHNAVSSSCFSLLVRLTITSWAGSTHDSTANRWNSSHDAIPSGF